MPRESSGLFDQGLSPSCYGYGPRASLGVHRDVSSLPPLAADEREVRANELLADLFASPAILAEPRS